MGTTTAVYTTESITLCAHKYYSLVGIHTGDPIEGRNKDYYGIARQKRWTLKISGAVNVELLYFRALPWINLNEGYQRRGTEMAYLMCFVEH